MENYKKAILLILTFIVSILITFFIKYYFRPFILVVIMTILCTPIHKFLIKINIPEKISGILCIVMINMFLLFSISYLGSELFFIVKNLYISNIEWISDVVFNILNLLNINIDTLKIGESVISIIRDGAVQQGAISTGEGILAYFIANICTFFLLIDKKHIIEIIKLIFPKDVLEKFIKQKNNFTHVIAVEGLLIIISTFEIIIGFILFGIPKSFMLGIFCGILDVMPYVGTIIVFIPIIIYNIIMRNYIIAFGLICLYILVEVIREILEAKFLGNTLNIHPLVILISIYIGVNIFGILGILVGPMYSILAKEIIYN